MGANIHGADLRKAIISSQRKLGESSTVSKEQLAKQMSHAVSTLNNTSKDDIYMAKFMKTVTGGNADEVSNYLI
jgi:hypothetical protein